MKGQVVMTKTLCLFESDFKDKVQEIIGSIVKILFTRSDENYKVPLKTKLIKTKLIDRALLIFPQF